MIYDLNIWYIQNKFEEDWRGCSHFRCWVLYLALAKPPVEIDSGTELPQLSTEALSAVSSMVILPPFRKVS